MTDLPSSFDPTSASQKLVDAVRGKIVDAVLIVSSLAAGPVVAASLYRSVDLGFQPVMAFQVVAFAAIVTTTLLRHRLSLRDRTIVVLAIFFLICVLGISAFGLLSAAPMGLVGTAVLATVLLGMRMGLIVTGAGAVWLAGVGIGVVNGWIEFDFDVVRYTQAPSSWIVLSATFALVTGLVVVAAGKLDASLIVSLVELRRARDAAETASRAKSAFLANMSHELRTPLNAVLALCENLNEGVYGKLSAIQLQRLATIEESGHHLLAVINDILDLAKVEAGELEAQVGPVDIEEVVQASMRFIAEDAKKKRLTTSTKLDPQVSVIETDKRRIKQILVNLLSNAVKFTPEGGRIGIEVSRDGGQHGVKFVVWDTGIGIAPEQHDRLFEPFAQVDDRLSREYEGTGLGLALVAKLTDLLAGSVSLESKGLGHGSRFTVTLPRSVQTEPRERPFRP